jgi:hypothetical protein
MTPSSLSGMKEFLYLKKVFLKDDMINLSYLSGLPIKTLGG